MKLLETHQLTNLLQAQPFPCISIYAKLGSTTLERRRAAARLRLLLKSAGNALIGTTKGDAAPFLLQPLSASADAMLSDFPENAQGIAMFRSFRESGIFPVDRPVSDYVAVADSFHLKPLLPLIQGHDAFYVVVLSQKRVRLYRGNEYRLTQMKVYVDSGTGRDGSRGSERSRLERGAPRGKVGRFSISRMPPLGNVEAFIRESAERIRAELAGRTAPIVLVGSPLLRRMYVSPCRQPFVAKEHVSAIFRANEEEAIHKAAWPIAKRELARMADRLTAVYRRLDSMGRASHDLGEIAREVIHGRVDSLLISEADRVYGRLDRDMGKVIPLSPEASKIGDDVLCDIAQEVMLRGGDAYLLPKPQMPSRTQVAAIYRW